MATGIEIFIGTSLDFLLSYKVKKSNDDKFVMELFIAHRCHNGSIICMETSGRYLATGGADDRIVVIDLKLNRDVHEIMRHEGSINSLSFTNKGGNLLSGSDDGRLVATTVGSWKPANIWKKPHTGKAVLKVCLHQSDKFALTLGKDGTLRGWDMLKGTQIHTFNTKDLSDANITLDNIELCPDGNTFAMSGAKTVTIITFTREEPYEELTLKSRVTSMCWLDDENLLIGMENGSIEWANIITSEHVNLPNIHTKRIKGMHHLNGFLGTICSIGNVSLWTTTISDKKLTLVCATTDASIRPTCIKLVDTTENRYKEQPDIIAIESKENLLSSVKQSRPISTTGKIIVEMESTENDEISSKNDNWKLQISDDDTDIEILKTPEKKTLKKKKTVSSNDAKSTIKPIHQSIERTPSLTKKRTSRATASKPIVVRSLNSDDDFESEAKRSKKKKTTVSRKKSLSTPIHDAPTSHLMATRRMKRKLTI